MNNIYHKIAEVKRCRAELARIAVECANWAHLSEGERRGLGVGAGDWIWEEMRLMRMFDSGATRDSDDDKPDYEGFLSPLVIERFGRFMHEHRKQADGVLRASDNWQKGIPSTEYMKSMWRHFLDVWAHHRKVPMGAKGTLEDSLCALLFNVHGYLFEVLKQRGRKDVL